MVTHEKALLCAIFKDITKGFLSDNLAVGQSQTIDNPEDRDWKRVMFARAIRDALA
jgi:hypothetical protein